jgi:hypothetical protein
MPAHFDCDASFKEGLPSDAVLGLYRLSQAWQISTDRGERFLATPFSEALDDPKDGCHRSVDRFQPHAEGIHKECPNKKHHRFLAKPHMPGIFIFGEEGMPQLAALST